MSSQEVQYWSKIIESEDTMSNQEATLESSESDIARLTLCCLFGVDWDETAQCKHCGKYVVIETKLNAQGLYPTCSQCGSALPD